MYTNDNRTVITLDAGGNNFVFCAVRGNEFVTEPLTLPSYAQGELSETMASLEEGFSRIIEALDTDPVAISFAFPGPADYPGGIIYGYLPNFPKFRDGVALGPFLEDKFGIPVFINNDGDLFAYGEALAGALPEVNRRLQTAGSVKRYRNLIGYTFGTGFGIGIVTDGRLHVGDNSCAETWCLRHRDDPKVIVEEGVAVRAIERVYGEITGNTSHGLTPKDICDIASGKREGNAEAALRSFEVFGQVAGDAIATAVTLLDGLVVIGGGLTGASRLYMPSLLAEMRSDLSTYGGDVINRLQFAVYDLDQEREFAEFARGETRRISVYGTGRSIEFDPLKRIGVITSKLGASKAISLGAYSYALSKLDEPNHE